MKELVLCDNGEPEFVLPLCEKYGCGIEIQGFYNPNLIDTEESDKLLFEYKNALTNFKGGKSGIISLWEWAQTGIVEPSFGWGCDEKIFKKFFDSPLFVGDICHYKKGNSPKIGA